MTSQTVPEVKQQNAEFYGPEIWCLSKKLKFFIDAFNVEIDEQQQQHSNDVDAVVSVPNKATFGLTFFKRFFLN